MGLAESRYMDLFGLLILDVFDFEMAVHGHYAPVTPITRTCSASNPSRTWACNLHGDSVHRGVCALHNGSKRRGLGFPSHATTFLSLATAPLISKLRNQTCHCGDRGQTLHDGNPLDAWNSSGFLCIDSGQGQRANEKGRQGCERGEGGVQNEHLTCSWPSYQHPRKPPSSSQPGNETHGKEQSHHVILLNTKRTAPRP